MAAAVGAGATLECRPSACRCCLVWTSAPKPRRPATLAQVDLPTSPAHPSPARRRSDALLGEVQREADNGRLLRLLFKLNYICERPELGGDTQWAETGDRCGQLGGGEGGAGQGGVARPCMYAPRQRLARTPGPGLPSLDNRCEGPQLASSPAAGRAARGDARHAGHPCCRPCCPAAAQVPAEAVPGLPVPPGEHSRHPMQPKSVRSVRSAAQPHPSRGLGCGKRCGVHWPQELPAPARPGAPVGPEQEPQACPQPPTNRPPQVDEEGAPMLDWGLAAEALNKVDAGVPEKVGSGRGGGKGWAVYMRCRLGRVDAAGAVVRLCACMAHWGLHRTMSTTTAVKPSSPPHRGLPACDHPRWPRCPTLRCPGAADEPGRAGDAGGVVCRHPPLHRLLLRGAPRAGQPRPGLRRHAAQPLAAQHAAAVLAASALCPFPEHAAPPC